MDAQQTRVASWMLDCFGPEITADVLERNDRFIEESLELTQSLGYSAERAHALVDYVFSRPVGEPAQEVGGTMVTLAALCNTHAIGIEAEFTRELDRITQPDIVAKIRAKQASKPTGSALPVAVDEMAKPKHLSWPDVGSVVFPRDPDGRKTDPVSFVLSLAAQPWTLAGIAKLLRDSGTAVVGRKMEAETASALHWLLGIAIKHGDAWHEVYSAEVGRLAEVAKARSEAHP